MHPAGFESAIPAGEWPQICALDRAATGNSLFEINYKILAQSVLTLFLYYLKFFFQKKRELQILSPSF
jgi:hypothetical protein